MPPSCTRVLTQLSSSTFVPGRMVYMTAVRTLVSKSLAAQTARAGCLQVRRTVVRAWCGMPICYAPQQKCIMQSAARPLSRKGLLMRSVVSDPGSTRRNSGDTCTLALCVVHMTFARYSSAARASSSNHCASSLDVNAGLHTCVANSPALPSLTQHGMTLVVPPTVSRSALRSFRVVCTGQVCAFILCKRSCSSLS